MKILTLLLLTSIGASAQHDFDYRLHTLHMRDSWIASHDSLVPLFLPRQVIKDNTSLHIVSTVNTGDADEYRLRFLGVDVDSSGGIRYHYAGIYNVRDTVLIRITPDIPIVEFSTWKEGLFLLRYY